VSTTWKLTGPKVALLFVSGLCAGCWIGRSVGSTEWRTLDIGISMAVAAVVLVSCRKKAPLDRSAVYVNRSRDCPRSARERFSETSQVGAVVSP